MNGRLARNTLGYSKRVAMLQAARIWEEFVYNFARPVRTLRCEINAEGKRWLPCSPMMAAGPTGYLWSTRDLLMFIPVLTDSL
jgi:hypothetical protein